MSFQCLVFLFVQPPYAEIIDECTKYICVNNQLVLFNKSQSCPFTAKPPNCGLLGFAVLVNGDKCCPKWDCPCKKIHKHIYVQTSQTADYIVDILIFTVCVAGRCSLFSDLNVITFDGNSFAIYKAAEYIVTQLSNETLSVLVQECPADSETPVRNVSLFTYFLLTFLQLILLDFILFSQLMWNFTNLCLVSLNITHKSNHVIINRLQRRVRDSFCCLF